MNRNTNPGNAYFIQYGSWRQSSCFGYVGSNKILCYDKWATCLHLLTSTGLSCKWEPIYHLQRCRWKPLTILAPNVPPSMLFPTDFSQSMPSMWYILSMVRRCSRLQNLSCSERLDSSWLLGTSMLFLQRKMGCAALVFICISFTKFSYELRSINL